jgi:hypothetical protein
MEADTADIFDAATAGVPRRLRVGIADRDSGFVHTVVKRLPGVAMEPVLADTVDPEALVPHRLDALVLDVEIVGDTFGPVYSGFASAFPRSRWSSVPVLHQSHSEYGHCGSASMRG